MHSKTIALAAVLLTGGVGTAVSQTNNPRMPPAPTAEMTPGGPSEPTISPSGPYTQKPKVNPSAAGTQTGWKPSTAREDLNEARKHGGSQQIHANTHPWTALQAHGLAVQRHPTPLTPGSHPSAQRGTQPQPSSGSSAAPKHDQSALPPGSRPLPVTRGAQQGTGTSTR
jgi:hypothetical protein